MEYEIADDPQGDRDRSECRRDGGLEEDLVALRRSADAPDDRWTGSRPQQMQG